MRNVQATGKWLVSLFILALAAGGCADDKAQKDNLTTGYAELDNRHFDQAIAHADEQLQKTPDGEASAEALYLKGRAYEQRVKAGRGESASDMATAADCYQRALKITTVPKLKGDILSSLGNVAYWQDNYAEALKNWSAAYDLIEAPDEKAFVLYRAGLCEQRLGQFDTADQTFAAVVQRFPGTDAAIRAHDHQGFRSFSVRLATFANAPSADAAVTTLRKSGTMVQRSIDAKGHSVVTITSVPTYAQAQSIKARFSATYPDAVILP